MRILFGKKTFRLSIDRKGERDRESGKKTSEMNNMNEVKSEEKRNRHGTYKRLNSEAEIFSSLIETHIQSGRNKNEQWMGQKKNKKKMYTVILNS